jgi:hypothetical protein
MARYKVDEGKVRKVREGKIGKKGKIDKKVSKKN